MVLVGEHPELPEPGSISSEPEAAIGIRGLRILARIIARDLTNTKRDAKKDNGRSENKREIH